MKGQAISDFHVMFVNWMGETKWEVHHRLYPSMQTLAISAWRFKENRPLIVEWLGKMDEHAEKCYDRGFVWSGEFEYYTRQLFPKIFNQYCHLKYGYEV